MQKETANTWSQGLISDLNPLSTPNEIMTDCINGTITTFNGNEFSLQTDYGNVKLDKIKLEKGFIPIGMKEYGGIMYIASYNPINKECEIGSFPSTKTIYDNLDDNKKPHYSTNDLDNPIDKILIDLSKLIDEKGNPITISEDFFKVYKENQETEEKELLQLKPGDQYKIKYSYSNDIVKNLISDNNKNRKLFKIKYFIKSKDGTLTQITKENIALTDTTDPLKGFSFFKNLSPGTLNVSYESEDLDVFNVINSVKYSDNKETSSIITTIYGKSNSLNEFNGIKLILYKEESEIKTKILEKYIVLKPEYKNKLVFSIDNLESNKTYIYEFIPFSKYNYFNNKKQIRKVLTDFSLSSISNTISIFKYFLDEESNNLMIQFDYNTNKEFLDLYLELYDPWSDVSTIKKIDSPSSFGVNSISFDIKEEPTIEAFNELTIGGININDLITEEKFDIIRKPILGSKKYVRKDFSLRKNHFYILRLCSLNQDGSINKNIYRVLYTSSILNDKNNNDNINDFSLVDLSEDLIDINFDINITKNLNLLNEEKSGFTEETLNSFTKGKAYKTSQEIIPETFRYEANKNIKNSKVDLVKIDIKNKFTFCKIEEDSINVEVDFTPSIKTIEELSTENYKPNSSGFLEINTIDKFNFELKSTFITNRNIIGIPVFTGQEQKGIFNSYPIINSLLYNNTNILVPSYFSLDMRAGSNTTQRTFGYSDLYNAWNPLDINKVSYLSVLDIHSKSLIFNLSNITIIKPERELSIGQELEDLEKLDGYRSSGRYYTVGGNTLSYAINNLKNKNKIKKQIGCLIVSLSKRYGYLVPSELARLGANSSQYSRDSSRDQMPNWKKCLLLMETDTNDFKLLRIHNSDDIMDFFNNVHICSYSYEKVYSMYPDINKIYTFNNIKTNFKYNPINLNISILSEKPIYKFYSGIDKNYINFEKDNILKYITLENTDEILIDNNNFPKLKENKIIQKEIEMSDYSITASSSDNNSEYNLLSDGENAYNNTLVAKPVTPNGSLFFKEDKDLVLNNFKDRLKVVDPITNSEFTETTPVKSDNFKIILKDPSDIVQLSWYDYNSEGRDYNSSTNELHMSIEQYE